MQFDVIYLETLGSAQPCVSFLTVEFCFVSLFLVEHTLHRTPSCCICQCLLCLVSSLFSWLVDGVCLPCLVVKMLSGKGSSLMWGGFVCHNPLRPPVSLWTAGSSRPMVCIVSPLCEVCVSNAICHCQCHHSL
jgi:hypothetical protein